jgi:hypothetical protein
MVELQTEDLCPLEMVAGQPIRHGFLLLDPLVQDRPRFLELTFLDEFLNLRIVGGSGQQIVILLRPIVGFLDLVGELEILLIQKLVQPPLRARIDALADDGDVTMGILDRGAAPALGRLCDRVGVTDRDDEQSRKAETEPADHWCFSESDAGGCGTVMVTSPLVFATAGLASPCVSCRIMCEGPAVYKDDW